MKTNEFLKVESNYLTRITEKAPTEGESGFVCQNLTHLMKGDGGDLNAGVVSKIYLLIYLHKPIAFFLYLNIYLFTYFTFSLFYLLAFMLFSLFFLFLFSFFLFFFFFYFYSFFHFFPFFLFSFFPLTFQRNRTKTAKRCILLT